MTGADSHRRLRDVAALDLPDVRPAILAPATRAALEWLLKFRLSSATRMPWSSIRRSSARAPRISSPPLRSSTERDIWDLDHLFRTTDVDLRTLSPLPAVPIALDRLFQVPYEAFKSQVVPFLEAEHQELYGTEDSWDRIVELVMERLTKLQP